MSLDNKPVIIGITGPFGSGKSTVSAYLEAKGFKKVVLSSYLEEEAKKRGKAKITRKLLQDIGNEWRGSYGRGVLAKKALESLKKGKISLAVVDGVRNVGEIEYLKKKANFMLLGVIADRTVRFNRLKKLKRREDLTPELFFKLDCRDLGVNEGKTGLQVALCIALSDYFVPNNEDKRKLEAKIDRIVKELKV